MSMTVGGIYGSHALCQDSTTYNLGRRHPLQTSLNPLANQYVQFILVTERTPAITDVCGTVL